MHSHFQSNVRFAGSRLSLSPSPFPSPWPYLDIHNCVLFLREAPKSCMSQFSQSLGMSLQEGTSVPRGGLITGWTLPQPGTKENRAARGAGEERAELYRQPSPDYLSALNRKATESGFLCSMFIFLEVTENCFPGGTSGKEPASAGDVRDAGSVPGLGRSSGGGHGNPLQYSCLENPMDRGA